MTKEETKARIEVMQAWLDGEQIQARTKCLRPEGRWVDVVRPAWEWSNVDYRVKPLSKPSVDWSVLSPDVKYIARDSNGTLWAYREKPWAETACWTGVRSENMWPLTGLLASADPGTCNWQDSLVERP